MLHRINSDLKNRNFGAAIFKMWLFDKLLRPSRPPQLFGFEKKKIINSCTLRLNKNSIVLDVTSHKSIS